MGMHAVCLLAVAADMGKREESLVGLSGELCSTYLAGCLTGLIQGWTFPARGGAAETIEFPFTFRRGDVCPLVNPFEGGRTLSGPRNAAQTTSTALRLRP
jgi:hypothetical protein